MTDQSEHKIDIQILSRFKEKADVLSADKYLALNQQKVSFSIVTGVSSQIVSEFPDDDIVTSFLMNVRMFIIKDENKFNFEKICTAFIDADYQKDKVSDWLNAYKKLLDQETMRIRVGNKELTTRMIFHTILNEEHFHQEIEQKGMTTIKASPFIEPMARMKFFDVLSKLRIIICAFNKQIVEKYLQEHAG